MRPKTWSIAEAEKARKRLTAKIGRRPTVKEFAATLRYLAAAKGRSVSCPHCGGSGFVVKRKSKKETYWEFVDRTAKEVDQWPEWKKGGRSVREARRGRRHDRTVQSGRSKVEARDGATQWSRETGVRQCK